MFLDETATTTKMTRLRGRARRGQRLKSKAPFGHWGTQTFIAALRSDGLTAPWIIKGAMNRALFDSYVETQRDYPEFRARRGYAENGRSPRWHDAKNRLSP
ncbi:transposase, partial [Azospirillum sp. SYSU D00513]|uniref:transposase n=1 Tax=Azospirillum sp. SYSU D00513 TaxID=2812561 RepID=UPI001A96795F